MSDFNKQTIVAEVLGYLKDHGALSTEETQKYHKALSDFLGAAFPEIDQVELLQEQCGKTVENPPISFRDSGLKLEEYIYKYFSDDIKAGAIYVAHVDDQHFRQRIAIEKARGGLPPELSKICITGYDILEARRRALHTLTKIPSETEEGVRKMSAFGRSLIKRHRKHHRPS